MSIKVVEVDLNRLEFRVQVQLRPVGNLTNDGRTPAHNLRLFLNASRGSQEIDFPTGEIMKPVEPKFFLDGNTNRYPFRPPTDNLVVPADRAWLP